MSANGMNKTASGRPLMPALLDRLTDQEPLRRDESPQARSISKSAYRKSVLRDLSWLLNTINIESNTEFLGAERAQHSVLNFGVPALSGRHLDNTDWQNLESELHRAISIFEPRILPDSLRIRALPDAAGQASHNRLSLEIKGQLWCEPYPLELLLHTHMDLECGQVSLENRSES